MEVVKLQKAGLGSLRLNWAKIVVGVRIWWVSVAGEQPGTPRYLGGKVCLVCEQLQPAQRALNQKKNLRKSNYVTLVHLKAVARSQIPEQFKSRQKHKHSGEIHRGRRQQLTGTSCQGKVWGTWQRTCSATTDRKHPIKQQLC